MTKYFVLFVLLLSACSLQGHATNSTVKIGLVAPLSADYAEWGSHVRNGVLLGLEDAAGNYELIVADSVGCNVRTTVAEVRRLIDVYGVKYIIGPSCITGLKVVAQYAEQNNVLLFSPGFLDEQVFVDHSNIVNWAAQIGTEVQYASAYFASQNYSRVALSLCTDAFCEEQLIRFQEQAQKKGFQIVAAEQSSYDITDFRTTLDKITQNDPDVIFVMHSQSQVGMFIRQARELGIQSHLHAYYNANSESTLQAAGDALQGVTIMYPLNTAAELNSSAFDTRYVEEFGSSPTANSKFAYDGATILDAALRACAMDVPCVKAFFTSKQYEGVSGDLYFDEHSKIHRPFALMQFREDAFAWA